MGAHAGEGGHQRDAAGDAQSGKGSRAGAKCDAVDLLQRHAGIGECQRQIARTDG
jgi:hypothetical protein